MIRVTKTAVKFRFGTNQTLTSELRILLPFCAEHQQVLWLSIEIVPGGTPLLFSKKAIKQLGGVIDTCEDVCHLKRLQKSLQLSTGPTGLYMVDLARLCEESGQEQPCQLASEDHLEPHPSTARHMHEEAIPKEATATHVCTDYSREIQGIRQANSRFR